MKHTYLDFDYVSFVDFYNNTFAANDDSNKITLEEIYRAIPAEQFDDENEYGVYDSFFQFHVNYDGEPFVVLIERSWKETEETETTDDCEEEQPF